MLPPITLLANKGAPLSAIEADGNIANLDSRVSTIEQQGLTATGIQVITFDPVGNTLLVTLTDGTTYGPYKLPSAPFTPRGDWVAGTAYGANDLVSWSGGSYLAMIAHVAGTDFPTDLASGKWMTIALQGQKGADFYTFQGAYSDTTQYNVGDGVTWTDPLYAYAGPQFYRLAVAAPAGTKPNATQPSASPGFPGSPYWMRLTSLPLTNELNFYYPPSIANLAANSLLFRRRIARPIFFQGDFSGLANLDVAPTNALTLPIYQNGAQVGVVNWTAGQKLGGFATLNSTNPALSGGTLFARGDLLTIATPSSGTPDPTAAGVEVSLVGYLQ